MGRMFVKLRGLIETQENLEKYHREVRELAMSVLKESAEKAKKKGQRRAPRQSGRLRRGIFVRFGGSKKASLYISTMRESLWGQTKVFGYQFGASAIDDRGRQYAYWTEFGKGAKPWLRPIHKTESRFVRRKMRRGVRSIISSLGYVRQTKRRFGRRGGRRRAAA